MGQVTVLMGISGAGKSTWIRGNLWIQSKHCTEFSADHWFMKEDENGEVTYQFNPAELGQAHAHCLKLYTEALQAGARADDPDPRYQNLVVDNTNTSLAEIAPYCALALAYGFELKIVALVCPAEVAAKRNEHGTPATAVMRQDSRFRQTLADLPPWWPLEVVFTD